MLVKRFVTMVLTSVKGFAGLVRLHLVPNTTLGSRISCATSVTLRATDGGTIIIGDDVKLLPLVEVTAQGGRVIVGQRTHIAQGAIIVCKAGIVIGSDCLIAEYVTIRDQNHRFGAGKLTSQSGFTFSPIVIGDNVWIGAKATVLAGVKIGENAVIGAGAVVTHDVPANSVAVGNPARTTRQIL